MIEINGSNFTVFIVIQVSDVFHHYTKPCCQKKLRNVSVQARKKPHQLRLFSKIKNY